MAEFRLKNRMPTFKEYVLSAFRKQMDEAEREIADIKLVKRNLKKMHKDLSILEDAEIRSLFSDEDKAVIEYDKMRATVDGYIEELNGGTSDEQQK